MLFLRRYSGAKNAAFFLLKSASRPKRLHATGALLMDTFLEKRGRLAFTFANANHSACE
jgi:hypothetical protein